MAQGEDASAASPFRAHFRWQAGWCRALGSPFTAMLLDLMADRLDSASPLGQRLEHWPGNMNDDALSLRVTGALHGRVRGADAPELAALYPPADPNPETLWPVLERELAQPGLLRWLESPPQTNEVARSAVLMCGFLTIAAETGLPLALLELGCSAGLNLIPDRYNYRLGNVSAGDTDSLLLLAPEWMGGDPPVAQVEIESRIGVDLNPPDISDWMGRSRMLAYVWPDQLQRLERMALAMTIFSEDPAEIVAGNAADFCEERATPRKGVVTTVFHSIALQYFSAADQQRIAGHLQRMGEVATDEAPLAWLRFEQEHPGAGEPPTLRLTLWPGGEDRLLAIGHPHGGIISWL